MNTVYVYVTDDGETQLSKHSMGWGQDIAMRTEKKLRAELKSYGHEDDKIDEAIRTVEAEGYASL